jgi:hypothetical protein
MVSKIAVLILVMLFSIIMVSGATSAITNMVDNPDFVNDTEGWSIGADYGSLTIDKNEKGIVGNAVYCKVDRLGANPWEPEIHSPSFPLDKGKTYTIDFWAKTEAGKTRNLMVKFEQLDIWGGPSDTVIVTDKWQHHHITAVSDFQSPPNSVIHIQFEGSVDDVWFSHFRVYVGEYVPEVLSAVTPISKLTTTWGEIRGK